MGIRRTALSASLLAVGILALFSFPRFLVTLVPEYGFGELAQGKQNDLQKNEENLSADATSTLFALGDIMLARHVEANMEKNGASYPYQGLSFLREDMAYVLANFEAAVPAVHEKTPNFAMRFSVNTEFLPALRAAGVTHLGLANNHTLDYGEEGFLHTESALAAADFSFFGKPGIISSTSVSYIKLSNRIIAIVALENITRKLDTEDLNLVFKIAEEKSDLQIAYIHWGEEYVKEPQLAQQEVAESLIDAGADLIVGHHPHVVQGVGLVRGVPVFYSLGNFIFDQYFSKEVQEGLVLRLEATDKGVVILGMPVSSLSAQAQPRLMTQNEAQNFYGRLTEVSDKDLLVELQNGTFTTLWPLATFKETVMMSQ